MKIIFATLLSLLFLTAGTAYAQDDDKTKEPSGADTAGAILKKVFIIATLFDTATVAAESCAENNCAEDMTVEKGVEIAADIAVHQGNEIKDAVVGGYNFVSELLSD